MLVVDSIGRSGGLALLWKDEAGIEIQNYSHRHINATVKPSNLPPWTFTGFYGHPDTQKSGPVFTWNNGREGADFTMEWLDRVVVAWHTLFPNVESSIELAIFSDHLPILINPSGSCKVRRRRRDFHFEAEWGEKKECKEVIKKIWRVKEREQGTWIAVEKKLKKSKGGLLQWQKVNRRQIGQDIQLLSEKLISEQKKGDFVDRSILLKLKSDLAKLQDDEDLYWRQRAKIEWMRGGDRNSKFFHACANQKKKANLIN
ncbi:uncharacterized protein LOC132165127 [Corylus avellana]|uniref:uncharacterized protein LOC132165127 n=1 Tax=Corylus avellana TaxID=13451 RepID=UPI00286B9039|nr:uncharacterized protein LOC132165127 [Corylus avellana]